MTSYLRIFMDIFRIMLTFTRPISDKILDLLYWLVIGPTKPLPPVLDEILLLPATELAERIRKRKLSAKQIMLAHINRIKEVQPLINAYTDQRFEDALKEAVGVDEFLKSSKKSEEAIAANTPLLGVPFTCKESVGVKGLNTTNGLVKYKNQKALIDSNTVALLRKAGAIPVVVTNVPVHCMWWESANHVYGWTKNPYDKARTPGGSSGGEGAIISAGGAVFGIGTDLAGSVRIPSSFCGIYGHKPSKDVIANHRAWPDVKKPIPKIVQYVSTGPMCRYVEDLKLLTEIMAGDTANKLTLNKRVNFRNVKFYYMEELPGYFLKATPDVKASIRKAVKHFEAEYGIKAEKLKIKELEFAFDIWESKLLECDGPSFKEMLSEDGPVDLFMEFLKSLFQYSNYTWPALYFATVDRRDKDKYYYQCHEMFAMLREKLESIFDEDAILLLPTHPEPPPHYLLTIPKYPNIAYTCIFNILGYPSSQIPAGMSGHLPIGIQAISSRFNDHLTLAAASELDKVFGGWISPFKISL